MSAPNTNILKQKITAAAVRQAKASLQNSLVQNIEKATARVFLDFLEIEVVATVSERTISSHTKTIEAMTSRLFGVVSFDKDVGLTGFDSNFINTAITHLAGGTASPRDERPVTNTDAAIFKLVINKILSQVFDLPEATETDVGMHGYELEKAPLMFLLAEKKYALVRVTIKDVQDVNLGQFELAIPLTCMEKISAMELHNSTLLEHDTWRTTMSQVAIDAPIELNTIVNRMSVSLGEILGMKKGDLLDLPNGSLTALSLEGRTPNGPKVIFKGHLGALKTHKAFKITRIPDEEYALF
ncbi:MAG: FliM/FliN family flagellar motor switch protein [Alphaproteobacteria bacterium]